MSRNRIEKAADSKMQYLDMARELLHDIELEHQRGVEWVDVTDAPALSIGIVRKLDYVRFIKFNDGRYYAQITGAFKVPS